MPERWKTRFYERYSDILKFNESCTEGEREILVLLELKNPGTRPFLQQPQTAVSKGGNGRGKAL